MTSRDAPRLSPSSAIEFTVNEAGELILPRARRKPAPKGDRFEAVCGSAQIKSNTRELMNLLRG